MAGPGTTQAPAAAGPELNAGSVSSAARLPWARNNVCQALSQVCLTLRSGARFFQLVFCGGGAAPSPCTPSRFFMTYHACMWPTDTHTHIHTYKHTYIDTRRKTNIHTNIHTYKHTAIHTDTHRHTHTYIHTYTHMHTYRQTHRHSTRPANECAYVSERSQWMQVRVDDQTRYSTPSPSFLAVGQAPSGPGQKEKSKP